MNKNLARLTMPQRWGYYVTFAALPGACVMALAGLDAAIVFELVVWIPQQRLFDTLQLVKSFPAPL